MFDFILSRSVVFFLPEIILFVGILLLILISSFSKEQGMGLIFYKSVILLGVILYILIERRFSEVAVIRDGPFLSNTLILNAKILIIFFTLMTLIFIRNIYDNFNALITNDRSIFILLSALGMMIMVSSVDFLGVYIGIELTSLPLYVLITMNRDRVAVTEAGMKYFIFGVFATCLILMGVSLIYGVTGAISFSDINLFFSAHHNLLSNSLGSGLSVYIISVVGLVFIIVGLLFKLGAVPYHFWLPAVYRGCSSYNLSFLAIVPKIALFVVLMRILTEPFARLNAEWSQIIVIVSIASMILGALGALYERNLKKFIAYSSINNTGFLLIAVGVVTNSDNSPLLLYLFIYSFTMIGFFAFISLLRRSVLELDADKNDALNKIDFLAGYAKESPFNALLFSIILLSLAGVIPFAGFFMKFHLLVAAINQGYIILAIIAVLTTLISAFYYLRIIKIMYFDEPSDVVVLMKKNCFLTRLVIILVVLFSLGFFLIDDIILSLFTNNISAQYW